MDTDRLEFSDDDTGVWAFDVSGHVDQHGTRHVFIEVNGESADLDVANALALAELIIRVCGATVRRSE